MLKEKQTSCPICQSRNLDIFNSSNYGECKSCGIVFQNPMPSEQELVGLYENYFKIVDSKANVGYENYEENRSPNVFGKYYLPWIEKYAKEKSGRFLDFGCGTGNLVLALKNTGYTNVEGCEFANDAFNPLQNKNIVCYECKTLGDKSKKYKYISMIDVIEHLREPNKDLGAISESLEPNGLLFIETINIDDFFVRNFYKEKWIGIAPAHTFLWGISSLKKLLELHNFIILDTQTYKISGSLVKRMIIIVVSLFMKKIRNKYKNSIYQLSFGDGVRIVAQKRT